MSVTQVSTYPIESNPATGVPTTVQYTPQNMYDLVVLDIETGGGTGTQAANSVATGVTGGGCGSWVQVGSSVTSSSGFLISTTRWMGVITSGVGTTVTATVTYAATPPTSKIDGAMFTEAALRPNVAWSIDADAETKITTATTALASVALTSTGTNGVFYQHFAPANTGIVGSSSGYTYATDTGFGNVVAYRQVSTTGSIAGPTATQNTSGSYARRGTIFQASPAALALPPAASIVLPQSVGRASLR